MRLAIAVAAGCLSTVGLSTADPARAAIRKHTEIRAQALGAALQQFAEERDVQLVYRSEVVGDHHTSGASGVLTFDEALGQVLNGTGLTYQYLEAEAITIVPLRKAPALVPGRGRGSAVPSESDGVIRVAQNDDRMTTGTAAAAAAKEDGLWDRFRVAQVVDAEQSGSSSQSGRLEEIVVTARRREERLLDTPVSVVFLGGVELERRSVTALSDLRTAVPNLNIVGAGQSADNAAFYIRGVGQDDRSPALDSGVGVYIDGIYRARMAGADLDLLDISSIEVLRGPQGTLYGRNTIGGAINISSSSPLPEPHARVQANVGNYDLWEVNFIGDLPLIPDKLNSRLSLGYTERDGYTSNIDTGEEGNDKDYRGARLMLEYLPAEDVTVSLNADWSRREHKSSGTQCIILDPALLAFFDRFVPLTEACQRSQSRGEFHFTRDLKSYDRNEEWGASLTADWGLSDQFQIKSITAFRRTEWESFDDVDATDLSFVNSIQEPSHTDQWTQEFQLHGSHLDSRLRWVSGIYLFQEDTERPSRSEVPPFGRFRRGVDKPKHESWAVFGQGSYDFSEQWSLTLGGRYTHETRQFATESVDLLTQETLFESPNVEDDFDDFSPMVSIAYKPTDQIMSYVSWSEGFKAGGFNSRPDPAVPITAEAFKPEKLEALELGVKSSWWGGRMIVNAALYDSTYEDMQLNVFRATPDGDLVQLIQNAGRAKIRGAEVDFIAALTPWWRLSGGYGLTDAEYREFDSLDPATGEIEDLSDGDLVNVPENTANISSEWTLPLLRDLVDETLLRVDYSYSDSYFTDVDNTPELEIESYELLNAMLEFQLNDRRTKIRLWGKNLTDERYMRANYSLEDSFGFGGIFWAEPRTYGVTLSHEFP